MEHGPNRRRKGMFVKYPLGLSCVLSPKEARFFYALNGLLRIEIVELVEPVGTILGKSVELGTVILDPRIIKEID